MSSSAFPGGFGFLLWLPILIAQWVGVIGLAKAGRGAGWWLLALGAGMSTLGVVGSLWVMWFAFSWASGAGGVMDSMVVMLAIMGMSGLGSLLFAVGFAMHGLRSGRLRGRIGELEMVVEAQNEQLNRQGQAS